MSIKNQIIEFAKTIGIEYIGFCRAEFTDNFVKRLQYSYLKNYNCEFQESDIKKE
ncbi:hypothetical protein PL321_02400 [Caloramator sp. mosi_1]|uniref:hypothetical protein n=1 Tax=Caloramator sp. mosi_1 TaxID=3023090 RepID=UPI002362E26C|nr:hypothetical protein [Caloramator sp. mosi_1]WDC84588.1 hypothetical protein PL321_02400 [Caloramator sp. mosi_1]